MMKYGARKQRAKSTKLPPIFSYFEQLSPPLFAFLPTLMCLEVPLRSYSLCSLKF